MSAADRLISIKIANYRAFRGDFVLDLPDGCNLLVYGENGAGKSSLYHSIDDFLSSPERSLKIESNRHRYNKEAASITLTFASMPATGSAGAPRPYVWSELKNDARLADIRDVAKGAGLLDYKALLRVHLLPTGSHSINLFDLLLNPLLAHYKNPASSLSLTFLEEWTTIQNAFRPRLWKPPGLDQWIREFNAGFERVVKDTIASASELLADFDKDLAVEVDFTPATYTWSPKKLIPPKITAKPSFKLLRSDDYSEFLNEARLSALAMAIYFAGLKLSPAIGCRLLVLDDILIGLDMSNRMTVLGIAEKLFRDWQVVILTYHKAWFEVLKARTKSGEWGHAWRCVTLRMRKALGVEFPVVVSTSDTLLALAQDHFAPEGAVASDIKAAAVYARTAFEAIMSWYCKEMRLLVTYVESRRELDTGDFLNSIEKQLLTIRTPTDRDLAFAILKEIKHARHFVLNPHSHFNPESEDEISAEIANGIRAVEDFDLLLRCLTKDDFSKPGDPLEKSRAGAILFSALESFYSGRYQAALDSLQCSFERHLDEWFAARGEMLPYGKKVTNQLLFATAGQRRLFSKMTWRRLRHAKPYLLGEVQIAKFNYLAFEAAARLLLHLRFCFLLGTRP